MKLIILFILLIYGGPLLAGSCVGRFVNPITDICWKCIFPIRIAGIKVVGGEPDPKGAKGPLCACGTPIPRVGIPISFWEPARLVDVTRTPYCLVNMGGLQAASTGIKDRGHVSDDEGNGLKRSFYNVHWYVYPVLHIFEVLLDFVCLEKSSIDVAYLTELDPLWNDDEKSAILNPEGILFGNPIAQAACAADCVAASVHLPIDPLFWCNGCQGSLYPFSGTVNDHNGGVQASLLLAGRMMAKLHREGLLWGYMGEAGLCGKYFMPVIRKSQYRTQMTYPRAQTFQCQPFGKTEVLWQGGREYPYQGEDFGYLIWRRRDCCLG
ncbi:conjugal transfer pilus assembly protein TraU [Candidatus Nucleicultrix amoebiphila]|uniref:Conjugal transfer protein n=1 Tax=Candidatus Nucleicultrix amoebiphila FS5 TaxID=1414854 RepID=A0A1W6N4J8_9PROT|nr:conjugal transfer pilus assembly protein TraU [Candidatus Nucleicultrix amoebiphila]ARN84774.1 conjugal transfer protein [Candidatus Nucleicultrix amoebiphila FS5]